MTYRKIKPNLLKSYRYESPQSPVSIWCFVAAIWIAVCMVRYADNKDNTNLFVGIAGNALIVFVSNKLR